MGSIKTALIYCKDIFVNITGQRENSSEEEVPSQSSGFMRFTSSIFNSVGNRKRSAPVPNIYEPEITDDEDDTPGLAYFPSRHKRVRVDLDFEMSSKKRCQQQKTSPIYAARGHGIPPIIEGGTTQPWVFPSRASGSHTPALGFSNEVAGPSHKYRNKSGLHDRMNKANFEEQTVKSNVVEYTGSIGASSGDSRYNPVTSNMNIETITLDDDDNEANPCASTSTTRQATSSLASGKREAAICKPQGSSITIKKGSSSRDSNMFSRCIGNIGRKIVGTTHSTAIRLQEKYRYKQLLMKYNVLNSNGIYETTALALTKSRVNVPTLQVMYNKFGSSPTGGAVTLHVNGRSLTTNISNAQELLSSDDASALVRVPRLFSTPAELDNFVPRTKAITYERDPEVIDLEMAPSSSNKTEQPVSPITPVTSRRNYVSSPSFSPSIIGNFSNLDDAMNNSALDEPSANDLNAPENSILALEDSPKETEEDISIIAEKIVNKSRSRSINTLALEQTLCPYVDRRWLEESRTSWRENQKHRERRIQEEAETMNILKRESTLEKDLEEKIRKKLTLTEIIVLEEPPLELPDITPEMLSIIDFARASGYESEVLAEVRLPKDTIKITRGDIKTLGALQWLNDNVINTYLGLIVLRSKQDNLPSVYAFQTFFYPKLVKEGYSNSLKRWTRKDDIFDHDLIVLPIHLGLHWCLACVDLRAKTIKYFDSLGGDNNKCLHALRDYIKCEMKERKNIDLNPAEWTLQNVKGIPQQENGSDCGMFSCKFAEYLSRDANLTFKQEDMPYYRNRMIYELIKSELMHP